MPFPPSNAAPYHSLEGVLNTARVRLNDAIQQLSGDILKDSQPFTQQMANSAWLRMQQFLANLGYGRLIDEEVISALPICGNLTDPATQCWIDWTGFYDGTQLWNNYALPQRCSFPLKVWDRASGYNSGWGEPLVNVMDGLPARFKYQRNSLFEWRNDRIYMPGTTIPVDLRIRFAQFFPFFETQGETQWYQQPVPIVGCLDALADYICVEACDGRDDIDSATFKSRAEGEAKLIFNRDVRLKNRSNVRRRPHSGPRNQGGGYGYGGYGGNGG
jgi:hypothetical protein